MFLHNDWLYVIFYCVQIIETQTYAFAGYATQAIRRIGTLSQISNLLKAKWTQIYKIFVIFLQIRPFIRPKASFFGGEGLWQEHSNDGSQPGDGEVRRNIPDLT